MYILFFVFLSNLFLFFITSFYRKKIKKVIAAQEGAKRTIRMIKDLRDWKKKAARKNRNKHQWGWFQHPDAGNVEYNIGFFNHITGADGGDTSVLSGSVSEGGMGESFDMKDKVTLYYDDIEVHGYYGPVDWETGIPEKEYDMTIDWEYEVDRDDIFVYLQEFVAEESPELSDEEVERIVSENFDALVDKYYQQLLDLYRDYAEDDAHYKFNYDEWDFGIDEAVNIRDALNKIDCKTCGKYGLLNMYDCSNMPVEKRAKLAEMLKENVSADKLYEYMNEESPWQIGLELFADNGHEYKVVSVIDEREVDGYKLSIVGAIGNELSNADEEVYFVLLDSDIEWGPVDTAEEAIEWASDVRDGYYSDDEDDFDSDDDIDFIDLYGAHGEYDDDYSVQKRHSMNEDTEGDERVKTFKLNGITYKISRLEDSLGNGGYVARWEDDSDNGLGYNNRGWISFDKNSYALHNEASKPIKDFMYVVSAYDRQPKKSVVDKLIATTVSMFGDDAVDTGSLDKKVGENLITKDWKDAYRYHVVTMVPPKAENILQGMSNDFDEAERIAINAMKRYASNPWEDDDRKIEAIENMLILDKKADPDSKDYAQVTLRMERVMDRLVDKIDPTDGIRTSARSRNKSSKYLKEADNLSIQDKFNYLKSYPTYNSSSGKAYTRPCRVYDLGLTDKQTEEFLELLKDGGLEVFWNAHESDSHDIYQEGRMGGHLILDPQVVNPYVFNEFDSYEEYLQDYLDSNYYPDLETPEGDLEYSSEQIEDATDEINSEISGAYDALVDFDNRVDALVRDLKDTLDSRINDSGGISESATSESDVEMKKGLASSKNLSKGITSHRSRSKSSKYLKEADNYGYVVYTLTLVDDNGNTYTEQDSIPATEFDNNPDLDPVEYLQEYYDDRIIEISAGEYINETLLGPNKESIKEACRRGNAMNEREQGKKLTLKYKRLADQQTGRVN